MTKAELHRLIDALPKTSINAAARFLEHALKPGRDALVARTVGFDLVVDSALPCLYDSGIGGWRQPLPLPYGQSQVHVRYSLSNRTTTPSVGQVTGTLDGVPLERGQPFDPIQVSPHQSAIGELLLSGGAAEGAHTLTLRYAVQAGSALNPAIGVAGPAVSDLGRSLIQTLAEVSYPYVAERALILDTDDTNLPYDTSDPGWSAILINGHPDGKSTYLQDAQPPWEWMPIRNPGDEFDDTTVVAGTVGLEQKSGGDLPFTHPFVVPGDNGGFDYEFYLDCDPRFSEDGNSLLASRNWADSEHIEAINYAATVLRLPVPARGVLGVEIDASFVEDSYTVQHGDRVVMLGRWIVDGGHDNYQSEIHPPLLIVSARPSGGTQPHTTVSKIVGRPYLVRQQFGGRSLRDHLIDQILGIAVRGSEQIVVRPDIATTPFSGVRLLIYHVRPPLARQRVDDYLLVSYRFTVRSGVAVQIFDAGFDTVGVAVVLNADTYRPPPLPAPHDHVYTLDDLDALHHGLRDTVMSIIHYADQSTVAAGGLAPLLDGIGALFGVPPGTLPSVITGVSADVDRTLRTIARTGFRTDRYMLSGPPAVTPEELTTVRLDELGGGPHFVVDDADNQPYPVFGELRVSWHQDLARVVHPSTQVKKLPQARTTR